MTCDRCGLPTWSITMSRFNTEMLCPPCEAHERTHPKYQEAADAERAAVLRSLRENGTFGNFPGIGKPADLGPAPSRLREERDDA